MAKPTKLQGSRNKDAFHTKERIFELTPVSPAAMSIPYDFGLEPPLPPCRLQCRVVGVIESDQSGKKETLQNDRIVAIEKNQGIEEFRVIYHQMIGKEFGMIEVRVAP